MKIKRDEILRTLESGLEEHRQSIPVTSINHLEALLSHVLEQREEIELFHILVWSSLFPYKDHLVHIADLLAQLPHGDFADDHAVGSLCALIRDGLLADSVFNGLRHSSGSTDS